MPPFTGLPGAGNDTRGTDADSTRFNPGARHRAAHLSEPECRMES
jgi:hypothetical protein